VGRDDHGVLDRVADLEEVTVEVHRVKHRAAVHHPDPHVLALANDRYDRDECPEVPCRF